jgi:hypothetical protein
MNMAPGFFPNRAAMASTCVLASTSVLSSASSCIVQRLPFVIVIYPLVVWILDVQSAFIGRSGRFVHFRVAVCKKTYLAVFVT